MDLSEPGPKPGTPQNAGEDRLSLIAKSARLGWWDWNIETGELVWSRECLEMFGLRRDVKMSYELFVEAIYPEDRKRVDDAVQAALKSGEEYSTEMRALWPDGSIHWIASRGRAYYDKSGKPVRMSGAGMDVTQFKETEENLRRARSEAKAYADNLAAILDAVPAITLVANDPECKKVTSSRFGYDVTGTSHGANVSAVAPPSEEQKFKFFREGIELARQDSPLQQVARTGKELRNYELELRMANGKELQLFGNATPLFDDAGKVRGAIGAFLDVTELKRVQSELDRARAEARAQADNFSAVFDAVPAAAFFSNDRECKVMVSNRAAYEMLRVPHGANVSLSAAEGERPKFKILENGRELRPDELPVQMAASSGLPVRDKELEIRFEDGSSVYEFGHAVPLFDEKGEVRGAVGAFLDITDRKVMEQRLRAATERFQIALKNTPITVFSQDRDLRYKWIYNPVSGYEVTGILGKRDTEFLERMEDAVKVEAIKSEVIRSGKIFHGEVEVQHQGEMRTFHATIEPQRDHQNNIIGITCASFDLTERKKEEREREKLVRQRQVALNAAQMGWWHYDAASGVSTWDKTFRELYGFSSDSGDPGMIQDRVHPEDAPAAITRNQAVVSLEQEKPYTAEYRIIRPDGSIRWVEAHGAPEFDGQGESKKVIGYSGTVRDITERKNFEAKLMQNQESFSKLVENAPYGIYIVDSQFRIAQMNMGTRTGPFRNVQPVDGRDFGEAMRILWHEPLASELSAIFRHTLETGEPYYSPRFMNERNDTGAVEAYEWELHRITLPDGQFGVVCYHFDSTQLRQIEDALRKQRDRFEFVAEGSDVGFWFCELPFDKLIWDKRVKRHFWLPEDDSPVSIAKFYELLHPDDREPTRQAIETSIQNNQQYDVEYRTMGPNGRYRWVRAIGRTLYNSDGEPISFNGITQDITARKQAEDAVRASETRYKELAENLDLQVQARTRELEARNEEMARATEGLRELSSRLLLIQDEERRRIARELHDSAGQILTALGLELAAIRDRAKASSVDLARQVEGADDLVRQLHSDIRTTSYLLHPPLLDEAGLSSALSWYVRGMSERSGIQVELDIAKDFGRLPRDMELIVFRLVQESLTNIHRHSGSKTARIRMKRDDQAVEVEIQDQGKGMAPGRLAAIRSGGSGVGIRGMRERLHQLRGELKIESSNGGTSVFATIPIVQDSDEESGMEQARAVM